MTTEYTNEKGEVVVIAEMESRRLIHAIAKYARLNPMGVDEKGKDVEDELVKALKTEAIKRLTPAE